MKLTAQREATVRDVEPGEVIVNNDGRWVVDEARKTSEGLILYCRAEGSASTRRVAIPFKSAAERVTVEAGPPDSAELLGLLFKLLAPPNDAEKWPYDAATGVLTLTLGTGVQNKIATRLWTLTISA